MCRHLFTWAGEEKDTISFIPGYTSADALFTRRHAAAPHISAAYNINNKQ